MRAMVTGGAGFIGSHFIEALPARGAEVLCIERKRADRGWLDDLPVVFEASGLDGVAALGRLVRGAAAVVHLAALTVWYEEAKWR